MPLNGFHPRRPATARLRIRPAAIRLEHFAHPNHPGCHLDVDKGDLGPEEERTGCVGGVDELGDLVAELAGAVGLLLRVLGLEIVVEDGDDVTVYLVQQS